MPTKLTVTTKDLRDYLVGKYGVNVKTCLLYTSDAADE